MSIQTILDDICRREGSRYTNIPGDRGGPTKWGITLGTLRSIKPNATAEDVKALTQAQACDIYKKQYIDAPGFSLIASEPLRELIIDCGVNHGPRRATKWLQAAVGASQDGVLGPNTASRVNSLDARTVFAEVLCTRLRFYEDLDDHPSQQKFDMGWTNRCCEFVKLLARMPA